VKSQMPEASCLVTDCPSTVEGNPYSSNDASMGPLMRVIKNKVCTDCELVALLDDDNGMELLVSNKIISLDLAVRDVYKKVWLAETSNENEPMKIVYRMTGLSGDATEDIIDNLDAKGKDQTKNYEDVYRLADELANNDALKVMLERLSSINQTNITIAKPLLAVLIKLFTYASKLNANRQILVKPEINSINILLQTLNLIFRIEKNEPNKVGVELTEQLLNVIETILSTSNKGHDSIPSSSMDDDTEQLEFLLNNIKGKRSSSNYTSHPVFSIVRLCFARIIRLQKPEPNGIAHEDHTVPELCERKENEVAHCLLRTLLQELRLLQP
jgi:E3 ubiquitin-protein ligase UBR4